MPHPEYLNINEPDEPSTTDLVEALLSPEEIVSLRVAREILRNAESASPAMLAVANHSIRQLALLLGWKPPKVNNQQESME